MAFPTSSCGSAYQAPAAAAVSQNHRPSAPASGHRASEGEWQGEHQLEKLEFALAVALTRGDVQRSEELRYQIDALGGNREEPGT